MNPQVSIILPTFNGSAYLKSAIDSCIEQTFQDWELIVVDDASSDSTPMILEEYQRREQRIRITRHTSNMKLPASLNTGFRMARGTYLTWISDDNCYRPSALLLMRQYLQAHSDVSLVYTDYSLIDNTGHITDYVRVCPPGEIAISNCLGPSFMYHRRVYEAVGEYSENMFLAEDYEYWLRISTQFRISPLHKDLYLYRQHEHSLSQTKQEMIQRLTDFCLVSMLPTLNWVSSTERGRSYYHLLRRALARREYKSAIRLVIPVMRLAPWLLRYKLSNMSKN